jgi:hypothetical protein
MSNRHRDKDKGRLAPFVPLILDTMKTPAWRAMSHGARSLYVALKQRYSSNFKNNGKIYLSTRMAADELGSHSCRDNVQRWFRELQYYGFIVMQEPGHLGVNGKGKAPHWRLTELGCMTDPPSRDFLHWDGVVFHEQKSPKYYLLKKQNPGPPVQASVDHPFRPLVDHPFRPVPSPSGPPVQAIQTPSPGPPVQAISSLTTPHLGKGEGVGQLACVADERCSGCRPEPLGIG